MPSTYPILKITMPDSSILTFQDEEIISASIIEQLDSIGATLPVCTFEASVLDAEGSFSLFGDTAFEDKQLIQVYENIDGTDHFMGNYFLDKWESDEEKLLKLEAVNVLGLLDTVPFDGRFWSSLTALSIVLQNILGGTEIEYEIEGDLAGVQLKGWIPPGDGSREALQQVCFAAGAVVITAKNDKLLFKKAPIAYTREHQDLDISLNDKFMQQPLSMNPIITAIELVSHNFVQGETVETVFDDTLEPGTYKIIFDKPLYDVEVNGAGYLPEVLAAEDGTTILTTEDSAYSFFAGGSYDFGPNYVILYVTEGGDVTITGHLWVDNQQIYRFDESGLPDYTRKNELKISDATLISNNNAQTVLDRMRDYYRQRYGYTMTLVPKVGTKYGTKKYGTFKYGWSTVNVTVGVIAAITTQYGNKVMATIEKVDLDLAGGFLARLETTGVESTE